MEYTIYPDTTALKNSWKEVVEDCVKILSEPVIVLMDGMVSSQLRVRLIAGRNLQEYFYDLVDVQVIFRIGGVELESEVKRSCRYDPEWRDEFIFKLCDIYTETLFVIIRDQVSNQKLGEATITLEKFHENVEERRWYPLTGSKGSLYLSLCVGTQFN